MNTKNIGMALSILGIAGVAYYWYQRKDYGALAMSGPYGAIQMNPGMGAIQMNPGMGAIQMNPGMGAIQMNPGMGAIEYNGFGDVALSGAGAGAAF